MPATHREHSEGAAADTGAQPEPADTAVSAEEAAAWAQLRAILLGPEQRDLEDLRELLVVLQDRAERLNSVSEVLPEALARRAAEDNQLSEALAPTIEETLRQSVARDPAGLADALFPVMAPAIRKSLREALNALLVSVNQALEYSLSPRSLRWRLEARRTGTSFASIVLRHTLRYRVEQILLIDRHTGLLLHHVVADEVEAQDYDLVSGMMTAIQDFAKDSFGGDDGDTLDSFQVGELTVWVVPGPKALVAAVIRGIPDPALREVLHTINEDVHARFSNELSMFDGDATNFERSHAILETALVTQYRQGEKRKKSSPVLWVVLALLLIGFGYLTFEAWQNNRRWNTYLSLLDAEPGLVVVETGSEDGKHVIHGLRDPLATDPAALLAGANLAAEDVKARWEPFQALDSALIMRRAAHLLQPPEGVALRLVGGQIVASGSASATWMTAAHERAGFLAGVDGFDTSTLVNITEALFRTQTNRLEQLGLRFRAGTAQLLPGQVSILDEMGTTLQSVLDTAKEAKLPVRIQVLGHASRDGSEAFNRLLSQQRAEMIVEMLRSRGLPDTALEAIGTGTPLMEEVGDEAIREANRSISFKVKVEE